jgi:hypothetical protein
MAPLPAEKWFAGHDFAGFVHRSTRRETPRSDQRSAISDRPVVGICNPWSEQREE